MASFTRLEPSERPAVVMDCGTGFTKMGFAGNLEVGPALSVTTMSNKSRKSTWTLLQYFSRYIRVCGEASLPPLQTCTADGMGSLHCSPHL